MADNEFTAGKEFNILVSSMEKLNQTTEKLKEGDPQTKGTQQLLLAAEGREKIAEKKKQKIIW